VSLRALTDKFCQLIKRAGERRRVEEQEEERTHWLTKIFVYQFASYTQAYAIYR